jgi:type II secretory pathway predicted ATPase ExeA/cell division septation protein DedD
MLGDQGMSSWVSHFGLSSDPFGEDPVQSRFFYGASYGLASLRLEQALEQRRGIILVTGARGSGKSALVRCVLGQVSAHATATVSATNTPPATVIDALLDGREPLETLASATRKRQALLALVEDARQAGHPIVCVVDDAHRATVKQLEQLFTALNIAPDVQTVLQVVLVGCPELRRKLRARSLAALSTRVTTHVQLAPLEPGDVAEYLADRLEGAGAVPASRVLPPATVAAVSRHSQGVIALCAAITRSALARAADEGAPTVSATVVDEVAVAYASGDDPEARARTERWRRLLGGTPLSFAAGMLILVAAVQLATIGVGGRDDTGPTVASVSTPSARPASPAALADHGEAAAVPSKQASNAVPPSEQLASAGSPARHAATSTVAEPFTAAAFGGIGPTAFDHGGVTLAQHDDGEPSALRRKFLDGSKYEVKIKPPPRPGAAPAAPAVAAPAARANAGASDANGKSASGQTRSTATAALPAAAKPATKGAKGEPSAAVPAPGGSAALPSPAPAGGSTGPRPSASAGPTIALQVGAFRELRSAIELRAKLSQKFEDVYISTVESGGEPLYRVRVGRLKSKDETPALRAKLQTAGYPSFRVTETGTP